MAEGKDRIQFTLNAVRFPELIGQPLSVVKSESIKRAREEGLGELGTRKHLWEILNHPDSMAAELLVPYDAYFFLGDEPDEKRLAGLSESAREREMEKYPHIHVDMDFFEGKNRKRLWTHTHGLFPGLRPIDHIAFIKPKPKGLSSPAGRL